MLVQDMGANVTVVMMVLTKMADWLLKVIVMIGAVVTEARCVVDFPRSRSMSCRNQ